MAAADQNEQHLERGSPAIIAFQLNVLKAIFVNAVQVIAELVC